MNIYVTLDYELFFGSSGTPEKCIIEPTKRLIEIADKYNFKCVFFVDSGYLLKLKEFSNKYPKLDKDYLLVSQQIKYLAENGHDIQLHIHPHWEDAIYNGSEWDFSLQRYRLDAFSEKEIIGIFRRYKKILEDITGKKINAYRAGGWCIQPFEKLKKAFLKSKIKIDSTVFFKGKNSTKAQWYDFEAAKDLDFWRFEDNPCVEDVKGSFLEIPIAYIKVSPLFFWKFAFIKKIGGRIHTSFGNGLASPSSGDQIKRLLTKTSYSVVSMDGYKSSLLNKAYNRYKRSSKKNLVIIGHPKAFTEYSLKTFEKFVVSRLKELNVFKTFETNEL